MIQGDLRRATELLSALKEDVEAYVLYGDLCLKSARIENEENASELRRRSIDLFTKAELKLESDLKCLGWNGFHESVPSVRANIYIQGAFDLATIKLRLSKLLSPDQGFVKAIEGWQSLQHTHESSALLYLSSKLNLEAGRLYSRIGSSSSSNSSWSGLDVKRFWTSSESENWITKASWTQEFKKKSCTALYRSIVLNMKSGTHNRNTLRLAFMELVSILGHENDESLRSRAAYYLTCSSQVSRMASCLQNDVERLASQGLASNISSTLSRVVIYRVLQSIWQDRSLVKAGNEDEDVKLLSSSKFLRGVLYCHRILDRE